MTSHDPQPTFFFFFCSLNQNGVEFGKWLPVLPAPPHTTEKRRRGREVSHMYGTCTDLGSLRFQLMTLQLNLCNDKIPKMRFNRSHSSATKHRPGKNLWKRKSTADIMSTPLLKSRRSWPGFLLVACEGLSRLYREITNGFFNISCVPKHQVRRKSNRRKQFESQRTREPHERSHKVTPSSSSNNCSSHADE